MKIKNMKQVSINVLDVLKHNTHAKDFATDHRNDSSYMDDAISKYADNNTSIYYSDIIKFISEHVEEVNDTIEEFGWEGCGSDLYKAGQMAEYDVICKELHGQMEDIWRQIAYFYFKYDLKMETIPEDLLDAIDDWAEDFDGSNRIFNFEDEISAWIKEVEAEEEEDEKE